MAWSMVFTLRAGSMSTIAVRRDENAQIRLRFGKSPGDCRTLFDGHAGVDFPNRDASIP